MKHEDFIERIKATPAYADLLPIHGERLFLKGVNGEYNILAVRLAWQLIGGKERQKHHNVEIHKEYSGGKPIEREVQVRGGWFGVNWSEAPENTYAWEATEEGAYWLAVGDDGESVQVKEAPLYGYNKALDDSYTIKPSQPRTVMHPEFNARYLAGVTAAFRDGTFAKIEKVVQDTDYNANMLRLAIYFTETRVVQSPTVPAEPQVYLCSFQGFFDGSNVYDRSFDILYLMG